MIKINDFGLTKIIPLHILSPVLGQTPLDGGKESGENNDDKQTHVVGP